MQIEKQTLSNILNGDITGHIIMVEVPTETYLDSNINSIKLLQEKEFGGVYVSFQRPCRNVFSIMQKNGVDTSKVVIIDLEQDESEINCVHIPENVEIDDLVFSIYTSLQKITTKKKFIFIDSMTTIAFYKPLSEVMRFAEFLIRSVRQEKDSTVVLFNVARDLADKEFIKDIVMHVDSVVYSE